MSRIRATALIAVVSLAVAAPALAGKPGGKNGASTASCTVSGDTVSATGLPMGQIVNFQYTDSTGTHSWVLGYSDTGTWSVSVPAPNGATTYQFISVTWGPNGSKYDVYASCSA